MKNNTNYSCLTIWKMLCVDTIFKHVKMAVAVGLLFLQIGLFGQNKWCSMGENAFHMVFQEMGFSPTRHQILPSPLRGSGQDTVSSWEKTPSLLENHVKCISCHGVQTYNQSGNLSVSRVQTYNQSGNLSVSRVQTYSSSGNLSLVPESHRVAGTLHQNYGNHAISQVDYGSFQINHFPMYIY